MCEAGSHCWYDFPEASYCAPDCEVPGQDCAAVPGSAAIPRCSLTSSTVNGCNIRCALSDAGTKGDCPGDLVCVDEGGIGLCEVGAGELTPLPAWSRCNAESVCEAGSHCWYDFPEASYCAPDCEVPGQDCAAVPGSAAIPRCSLTSSTVNGCNIRCALSDAGTKGDCPGDLVCVDEGGIGLCEVGAGG
ncbi:MAG TPA: hypothetical protein PLU22_09340 [Polyangiaceae bacterium]|nr:hypothetical protein [Polyangiaceae bacterium]